MPLPSNVSFGTVVGRFLTATADGSDADRDPDGVAATGRTVTFSPSLTPALVRDASASPPVVFALSPVSATVGADGTLLGPDGAAGVRLVASTNPNLEPTGWAWTVSLSGPAFPSLSFSFVLDPGTTVDLASVVQVPAGPGQTLAQWLQAVTDAQAARDAAVAAAASVPSAASLAATYAPVRSNRIAYLGDSITNFNAIVADSATSSHQNSRGFGQWLQVFSRQAFHVVGCFGYSGYTVAQIRTQLPNALATHPRFLFLLAGVNSVNANVSATSIISDFQAIYDTCAAAGVTVIHGTIWPATAQLSTPAQLAVTDAVNAWIVQQSAITPNVIVVPWHIAMIDPATGGSRTNYCEDGTHPSSLGAAVLGRYAWNVLQPLAGISGSESLPYYNGDTSNLVVNPMFTGTGGTNGNNPDSGLAANWYANMVGNIFASYSKVASTDGLGDWQQIQVQGGAGGDPDYIDLFNVSATIPASGGIVNQSDVVFGQIEFETDADFANASKLELALYNPSTANQGAALRTGDNTDTRRLGSISGIIRTPPMVPGDSQLQLHLRVGGLSGGNTATIRVRRASIKKIATTDGLI